MNGSATPFWFAPPNLSDVKGQVLGVGDGATVTFPLKLTVGAATIATLGTSGVSAAYVDGVATSSWALSNAYPPALVFAAPPAAGALVSADFTAVWLCRFAADGLDLEEFMSMLYRLRIVRLTAVRP